MLRADHENHLKIKTVQFCILSAIVTFWRTNYRYRKKHSGIITLFDFQNVYTNDVYLHSNRKLGLEKAPPNWRIISNLPSGRGGEGGTGKT